MKISLIKIKNILGISDLDVKPGQFNEVIGANGTNKTSFLNAIKSVIEGGHDATLLHKGAEKGEVVLVLDDGLELKKTVTAKASRVEANKGGIVMKKPMETVAALADLFSVNPIAFLTAPKNERARVMLESMPIELDKKKLAKLAGFDLPEFSPGLSALTIVDTVRKQVYDTRTDVNRTLDEKKKTIEQLRQAMPEAPPGVSFNESEIETSLRDLASQCQSELEDLEGKVSAWMSAKDERQQALQAEHDAAIDALRQKITELNAEHQQALSEIQEQTTAAKDRRVSRMADIKRKYADLRQPLDTQLHMIRTNRNAVAKREQTLEMIAKMEEESSTLETESNDRTDSLLEIDQYKNELLKNLPIPNIEVRDGEIWRDGVPFDRLNTAQRTDIAIEIAKLRAGKLGLVCCDGIEVMDPDAYEQFQQRAIASGLQFFVTRVGRGDLQINKLGAQ